MAEEKTENEGKEEETDLELKKLEEENSRLNAELAVYNKKEELRAENERIRKLIKEQKASPVKKAASQFAKNFMANVSKNTTSMLQGMAKNMQNQGLGQGMFPTSQDKAKKKTKDKKEGEDFFKGLSGGKMF